MIDPLLKRQLMQVFRQQRRFKLAVSLAACWSTLAILGLMVKLLQPHGLRLSSTWPLVLAGAALVAGTIVLIRHRRARPDWHEIGRGIELQHPELNGLLLTAVQQEPVQGEQLHYLQQRIVREALSHAQANPWEAAVPSSRFAAAQIAHLVGLLFLVCVLMALGTPQNRRSTFANGWTAGGVTITPGDTSIERGERL